MSLQKAFQISASGLTAQRVRMETIASNLANARTTRTDEGGPYQRKSPIFSATSVGETFKNTITSALSGVRVDRIYEDNAPPVLRFEPGHPDANPEGFVAYPDIDPVKEMVDMLSATRSYEANINVVKKYSQHGASSPRNYSVR